jgi:hypothetical protein
LEVIDEVVIPVGDGHAALPWMFNKKANRTNNDPA